MRRETTSETTAETEQPTAKDALAILLAAIFIVLLIAMGGDDESDLRAHAQWMQRTKEDGACVLW